MMLATVIQAYFSPVSTDLISMELIGQSRSLHSAITLIPLRYAEYFFRMVICCSSPKRFFLTKAAVIAHLEKVLWLVDIPFESRPGNYNSQRINHLTDTTIAVGERVSMVQAIAAASELVYAYT